MKKAPPAMDNIAEFLKGCLSAWSRADVDLTASFYADNLEGRDPMVPQGIFSAEEII